MPTMPPLVLSTMPRKESRTWLRESSRSFKLAGEVEEEDRSSIAVANQPNAYNDLAHDQLNEVDGVE